METKHKPKCGFCYDREQGTHGEIKGEWSREWMMFITVCRKHAAQIEEHNEERAIADQIAERADIERLIADQGHDV